MPADPAGSQERRPLLAVVGPTAAGKTAFSIQVARTNGGEIVSADSRLFYRGMDIGTDKPAASVRQGVSHHLVDVREPDQTMTLGEYQRLAYAAINQIQDRRRLPILVGGTGQYVRAVLEGWGIPEVAPNRRLRAALNKLGQEELSRWLRQFDPQAAEKIDPRNVRRTVRALEVTLTKGRPISDLQRKRRPPYDIMAIGLTCRREALYGRIDVRVDEMMASGLVEEVRGLVAQGCGRRLPAMSGLGYKQLAAYLAGEMSLSEAVDRIKFETHRFVRQQYTWFRRNDPDIYWFDTEREGWQAAAEQTIVAWLAGWPD